MNSLLHLVNWKLAGQRRQLQHAILGTRLGISLSPPQNHHHWLHLSALLRKLDETPLFQTPIQLEMLVDLVRALSRPAYSPYRRGHLRHS